MEKRTLEMTWDEACQRLSQSVALEIWPDVPNGKCIVNTDVKIEHSNDFARVVACTITIQPLEATPPAQEGAMNEELRRMNAARNSPATTCPASRHAALIAEALINQGKAAMIGEEPEYVGESIAATVAALWEARAAQEGEG